MINCEFYDRCWRYSYSARLLSERYNAPPNRVELFISGFATIKQMPKKGIWAEKMPSVLDGRLINICPALQHLPCAECLEWQKEHRRQNSAKQKALSRTSTARPRVSIPPSLRRAVAQRDKYTCVYCGRSHNQKTACGEKVVCVIDHFVPLALGGAECDPENLVMACKTCNRAKSAQLWERGCRRGYYEI